MDLEIMLIIRNFYESVMYDGVEILIELWFKFWLEDRLWRKLFYSCGISCLYEWKFYILLLLLCLLEFRVIDCIGFYFYWVILCMFIIC